MSLKIALFDPYLLKFTQDMVTWWQAHGHEVRVDRYYDPGMVEWADVLWFDTCDNNIKSATNPSEAILSDDANFKPWDLHEHDLTGKKVIVRPIDIEVWYGHQDGSLWDVVTDAIFVAPHIQALCNLPENVKQYLIPCSVDLDRYQFREHEPGFNIAVVAEKWTSKGSNSILQIALKLSKIDERYKIHWLGRWSDYEWEKAYFNDFIEHHKLNFEFTEWIEGDNAVDEFLEDKDYILSASHKEAFGYNIAEGMAKGLKPVIHRFYGADDLWPRITWDSIDEAVNMIVTPSVEGSVGYYNSASYRAYLTLHGYTIDQMMEKIMEVIEA